MKIMLINIDSKIPNLALKKIEKYHIDKGDEVVWDFPLEKYNVDKVYVSCIFLYNKWKCEEWEGAAEIGGSGYDIKKRLPKEIEAIRPRINWGFTTRGCIRKCSFCFVPEKEGYIHVVGDIYDIWDGVAKEIVLMDNNILALPKHFYKICSQLKSEKLKVDFNQGLDHRLLTPHMAKELLSLKHSKVIRFAFDHISYKKTVLSALEMLEDAGIKNWESRWYIYISGSDTFDTVFERMELLRQRKQGVYVMRNRAIAHKKEWVALASWGNMMGAFKMPLKEVLIKSKRLKPYAYLFKDKLGQN